MFDKIRMAAGAAAFAIVLGFTVIGASAQAAGTSVDDALAHTVLAQINRRPELSVDLLRVQSIDGVVYLYGHVDNDVERKEAEKVAYGVPNVVSVVNELDDSGE